MYVGGVSASVGLKTAAFLHVIICISKAREFFRYNETCDCAGGGHRQRFISPSRVAT